MTAAVGRRLLAEFIAAQLAGGAIGTLLAITVYPARPAPVRAEEPAQLTR